MSSDTRRRFLANSGKLIIGTVALGALSARAAEEHQHGGAGNGLSVAANAENRCGTCEFWGGMRQVSEDKSAVVAQSMGWCNNPDSPNHRKLTPADHEMQKTGIWKRWAVL